MTCRHRSGDPNCSSSAAYQKRALDEAFNSRVKELESRTPLPDQYEIIDVEPVNNHIVLRVKYPNCAACAYEGIKVMVFLDVSIKDVIRWRLIDPHFRSPRAGVGRTEAPPPAARFPASDEGWSDALAYARAKK